MEKRAGTFYYYLPDINEIKSFIAFHHEYSQSYIQSFVKRYLSKALLIHHTFSYANDVDLHQMDEIGVLLCSLHQIDMETSEEGTATFDYICTSSMCPIHNQPNMQPSSEYTDLNLSTPSNPASIQLDSNRSGSSNESPVWSNHVDIGEYYISRPPVYQCSLLKLIGYKRLYDDDEYIEDNPSKKQKLAPEYV